MRGVPGGLRLEFDRLADEPLPDAKGRKVGDPFDTSIEQGPQVSQEQFDRVLG